MKQLIKDFAKEVECTSRMIKNINSKPNKIVIFRIEHIGDYALSLPALKAIRKKCPYAQIDLVVGSWNKELAKATPYIDNIILFDNPLTKRHITYKGLLKAMLDLKIIKFARYINKKKYNLLISFSDRKYNKIFLKLFRIKNKISGDKWPNNGIDERQRLLNLMKKYNICDKFEKANLNISKKDKTYVDNIIGKKKIILIHPITPLIEKNWGRYNWTKLIKKILKNDKNTIFFLIGTKDQRHNLNKILTKDNLNNVMNLGGLLSTTQLVYLIKKSKLIIGCDSGPVHLAELTNTPIISLFGNTNEIMWGTPKDKGITIKKEDINDITVDEVLKEVNKIFK